MSWPPRRSCGKRSDAKLRSSKYLNNLIEQDHRGVKQRIAVMLGFKRFRNAAITIAGIELMHCIKRTVRTGTSGPSRRSCARSLERGAWGLTSARRSRERLLVLAIFAPQPDVPLSG